MNWGLGSHSTARTGIKQSLSQAYQVWCPHVAQAPRVVAKQAQATSLAAPSYAPGGLSVGRTLLPDDTGDTDSHNTPGAEHERPSSISLTELQADVAGPADASSDGATDLPLHVATWASDHSDPARIIGEAGASPASSGSYRGARAAPVPQNQQHLCSETSNGSNPAHTRPPADRTAEASCSSSTTASSAGLFGYSSCSSSSGNRRSGRNSAVGRTAAGSGGGCTSNLNSSGSSSRDFRQAAHPTRISSHASHITSGGDGAGSADPPATVVGGNASDGAAAAAAASSSTPAGNHASSGASAACADAGSQRAAAGGRQPVAAPRPPPPRQQPLTLERLREQTDAMRALELEVLQQRLGVLCGLLQLDETSTLMLCRVVPGLLLSDSPVLQRTWRRLCVSLGGEEPARAAAAAAPLLLVLPSERVPACVASLAAATALPRAAATAFVAEWPQLATHAPASLAAKLDGLRQLLGPLGPAAAGPAASPATLRAALRAAPRLLTFSTSALTRHHCELSALLGSTERLRTALAREPGLLLQRPSTVAAKLALLRQLMDCDQQPGAVAALVVRAPGLLRRSLAALSSGCRALSIWQFRRRDKLRMCISRPGLLALPPVEVHGRCRWLRRLMLSNAYYHAALRRLPPSLVGVVVAVLPGCWARLQYLAESSQECRMCLMDVVECRQVDFCARFPEFERWLQFKTKLMGAENPWRGTLRIRGFNTARDKPTHGAPNQMNLLQRQQHVAWRPRQQQQRQQQQHPATHGSSVPVVLAEAGEVRSGGSTVSRPRRVLSQPTAPPAAGGGPPPLAPLTPPAMPPMTDGASGPLTMIILPAAAARTRLSSEGLDVASTAAAAIPAAAVSAAAAAVPR